MKSFDEKELYVGDKVYSISGFRGGGIHIARAIIIGFTPQKVKLESDPEFKDYLISSLREPKYLIKR